MTTELKPCPFCGGEAYLWWNQNADQWAIECSSTCDLMMCEYAQSDVVAAWNTRHTSQELQNVIGFARIVVVVSNNDEMTFNQLFGAIAELQKALEAYDG